MRQAQAGDQGAFEQLMEQHASDIYRLSAAIVGEADARDATQETFVQAWSQLPRLPDASASPAWLRRICYELKAATQFGVGEMPVGDRLMPMEVSLSVQVE